MLLLLWWVPATGLLVHRTVRPHALPPERRCLCRNGCWRHVWRHGGTAGVLAHAGGWKAGRTWLQLQAVCEVPDTDVCVRCMLSQGVPGAGGVGEGGNGAVAPVQAAAGAAQAAATAAARATTAAAAAAASCSASAGPSATSHTLAISELVVTAQAVG